MVGIEGLVWWILSAEVSPWVISAVVSCAVVMEETLLVLVRCYGGSVSYLDTQPAQTQGHVLVKRTGLRDAVLDMRPSARLALSWSFGEYVFDRSGLGGSTDGCLRGETRDMIVSMLKRRGRTKELLSGHG